MPARTGLPLPDRASWRSALGPGPMGHPSQPRRSAACCQAGWQRRDIWPSPVPLLFRRDSKTGADSHPGFIQASAAATHPELLVPDTLRSPFLLKRLTIKNTHLKKSPSEKIHRIGILAMAAEPVPVSRAGCVGVGPESSSRETTVGVSSLRNSGFWQRLSSPPVCSTTAAGTVRGTGELILGSN